MAKRPKKPKATLVHSRDGQKWTQQETDTLLDLYLAGRGLKVIALELRRPIDTITNHVWKVATGYQGYRQYSPVLRNNPTSTSNIRLNRREVKVLEMGLYGAGQDITPDRLLAVDHNHLACVLNRPVSVVQQYASRKSLNMEGFL